jgi:hypothetical protein
MRVATFFPFQATYYLNGHSFIEQELNRANIAFRKNDNAFLTVDNVEALQRGSTTGPSSWGRSSPTRSARRSISRVLFDLADRILPQLHLQEAFPDPKDFERSCELGLWPAHSQQDLRATLHRKISGKLATVIDQIEHGHHVY